MIEPRVLQYKLQEPLLLLGKVLFSDLVFKNINPYDESFYPEYEKPW